MVTAHWAEITFSLFSFRSLLSASFSLFLSPSSHFSHYFLLSFTSTEVSISCQLQPLNKNSASIRMVSRYTDCIKLHWYESCMVHKLDSIYWYRLRNRSCVKKSIDFNKKVFVDHAYGSPTNRSHLVLGAGIPFINCDHGVTRKWWFAYNLLRSFVSHCLYCRMCKIAAHFIASTKDIMAWLWWKALFDREYEKKFSEWYNYRC